MLGIFLDIETNGLNINKHKVIEIAHKIVDVCTGQIVDSFHTTVFQHYKEWKRSDPLSLKVNGFTWNDIKDGMLPEQVAEKVRFSFLRAGIKRGKAVFICQNPSFDRGFFNQLIDVDAQESLNWPYHWLDLASMYWMHCFFKGSSFPWETGLSKNKIAAAYDLPTEAMPHKAMNGVDHLLLCYRAIVGFPEEEETSNGEP